MICLGILIFCITANANALSFDSFGKGIMEVGKKFANMVFTNTCVEDLGCFYTGPPFCDIIKRPICLPPVTELQIKFYLYTPRNKEVEYHLEPTLESFQNSPHDSREDTIFLIHGFVEVLLPNSTRFRMKDELLKHGNCNVVIVDWTAHNLPPYSQAVSNTRSVGAYVAKLIRTVRILPIRIHIVGHSLGAHIAGYVGKIIPGIGKITGLDPAGPFFNGMGSEVCLSPSDALLVIIIHTNAAASMIEGSGTNEKMGCLDFYPNGGSLQPGCMHRDFQGSKQVSGNLLEDMENWVACDHLRADELFISSIANSSCSFNIFLCSNYEDFKNGLCQFDYTAVKMGFYSSMVPGLNCSAKLYFNTSDSPPYCNVDGI